MKLKRIKSSKANNKWKKGHSCASNPANTKFRDAAKNHYFAKLEGESSLTVEALAQHTATLSVEPQLRANADEDKTIGRTFNTFATNFTTCTIPAFERFFRNFSVDSELQTRMLAIHAAAQEYIQETKLPETSTSYMCALMASLEGIKDSEGDVTATLSLLAKVIRKVSRDVLRAEFSFYSKLFQEILNIYSGTANVKLINNVIGCLSILLRAQSEDQWSYQSTLNLFQTIISYTTHENADIRRSAQYNVSAVLRGSSFMNISENIEDMDVKEDMKTKVQSVSFHPAAHVVGKFILVNLNLATVSKNGSATLYLLIFLQLIINSLPDKELKRCCEKVLGVMQIGDNVVNSRSLKVFGALFSSENEKFINPALTAETVEALINALTSNCGTESSKTLNLVPSMNKPEVCTVWMNVVASGIAFISKNNRSGGLFHFNNWVEQLTSYWKSDYATVHEQVWHTFDYVFDECISPVQEVSSYSEVLLCCFKQVQNCLSLQCEAAWPYVFRTLDLFFGILGRHCPSEMMYCVKNLASLMNTPDVNGKKELESTIGAAILGMGPECVMSVIPLSISGEIKNDEVHFWILPILKKYVKNCRLTYFVTNFIPITNQCFLIIKSLTEKGKGDSILANAYKQVECQIWSLLPSFADGAVDIKEALTMQVHSVNLDKQDYTKQSLAQLIGNYIKHREDTRLEFLNALRNLLKSTLSSTIMGHFSKNFLPILFNVYIKKPKEKFPKEPAGDLIKSGQRLATFSTIKCYISVVPVDTLKTFFNMVMKKFNDETDIFKKKSFMDLSMVFIPYLDKEAILSLYLLAEEHIRAKKSDFQKTSYRILEEILGANTDNSNEFIRERLEKMCSVLFFTTKIVAPNARAPRVKCLSKLLPFLQPDVFEVKVSAFFKNLVGEAIDYCGKKNSTVTRKAGYTLIRDLGVTIQRLKGISYEQTFEYIFDLLPSFTPITDSTSNVIYMLTILHVMYDDVQNPKIVNTSIPYIASMLCCDNSLVVTSCLTFIRISFSRCLPIGLSSCVEIVMKNIVAMSEEERLKVRKRIRDVLALLVKKFNADRIKELVPEDDTFQKVINNLVKMQRRKKQKKKNQKNQDQNDDDSDCETMEAATTLDQVLHELDEEIEDNEENKDPKSDKNKLKSAVKKKQTWIKEDEDEIFDFLDPESSHKVTSKKPREKKLRFADFPQKTDDEKYGFKFDKNKNKFIIKEDWNDREKRNHDEDDDDDDDDECMALQDLAGIATKKEDAAVQATQKKRKRNISENSNDSDRLSKYSAGTNVDRRKKKKFDYGAEFRAKKAGGDKMKKGGLAPYAYVQFSRDKLNKRKTAKYAGQFKSLVRGAKRGASKGSKSRSGLQSRSNSKSKSRKK